MLDIKEAKSTFNRAFENKIDLIVNAQIDAIDKEVRKAVAGGFASCDVREINEAHGRKTRDEVIARLQSMGYSVNFFNESSRDADYRFFRVEGWAN